MRINSASPKSNANWSSMPAKAREGKIKIEDLRGGVFTLSNGGIYGSLLSTPILNPPQSEFSACTRSRNGQLPEKGQIVIRPMMYLALSYDHRVVDGKEASLSLSA
jgi:2-oxoglutarate dehydrogenase E2 component (dihydrolipoamide succinyltransferase)